MNDWEKERKLERERDERGGWGRESKGNDGAMGEVESNSGGEKGSCAELFCYREYCQNPNKTLGSTRIGGQAK